MKVYVDSRNRASGSAEDFVWQLPETVDIPPSLCYLDVVCVPNTFYSINQGVNDRIRFLEELATTQGGAATSYAREAVLPEGQYNGFTLASALQDAMRAVTAITPDTLLQVTFDPASAKLKFVCGAPFDSQIRVFPDGLLGQWNAIQSVFPVDLTNTQSAGLVCGLIGSQEIVASTTQDALADSVISVQRHHNLFIHSDLGELGSSYGPRGESDIIRRVTLDSLQNALTVDRHTTQYDAVEVAAKPLRSMSFRLADIAGRTVNLRGHPWSFSLIFHEKV